MQVREIRNMPAGSLENLLRAIPFYKEIQQQDAHQFECLLSHSKLVELDPGDTIMRSGDRGTWLYFLLKGQLVVYPNQHCAGEPVNHIRPGEIFGDLAMLSNNERRATVQADPKARPSLLFATNFAAFGEINDYTVINLATKLVLYRMVAHSVRWKLEVNKMNDPKHELVEAMRRLSVYTGPKGGEEELLALYAQAQSMAGMLIQWNNKNVANDEMFYSPQTASIDSDALKALDKNDAKGH